VNEDIDIRINVEGGGEGATETDRVSTALRNLAGQQTASATAATALAQRQQAAATQAIAFGQRLQGVAAAAQSLVSQLGGQSRTAGLIGATIASTAQFAQMGATLGPQGAVVGGILGALVPALTALVTRTDDATEATRRLQEREDSLAAARASRTAERRAQVDLEVESGRIVSLSIDEIQEQVLLLEQAQRGLDSQRQQVNALGQSARRAPAGGSRRASFLEAAGDLSREVSAEDARITASIRALEARQGELQRMENEGGRSSSLSDVSASRGGGGMSARQREQEALQQQLQDDLAVVARLEEERIERIDREAERTRELWEAEREQAQERKQRLVEEQEAAQAAFEHDKDRANELADMQRSKAQEL
jgi:hypothetical protein